MGTHKDMCKISLVSGFQTPRSSCSKLDMRATPEPTKQGACERVCHPSFLLGGIPTAADSLLPESSPEGR